MISRSLSAASLAVAMFALGACDAPKADKAEIAGTVAYRERMALPPNAEVEVKLVDVSLADAPSVTIAETKIEPKGAVPIPYTLSYDPTKIESGHSYALQARITEGDHLLFITTTHHAFTGNGEDKTDLLVQRVGG